MKMRVTLLLIVICLPFWVRSQSFRWISDNSYLVNEKGEIVQYTLPAKTRTVIASKDDLKSAGPLKFFSPTPDGSRILVFTNTKKVWRLETRGDYWLFDTSTKQIKKLGNGLPASSLMFAKLSPDKSKAAYVSEFNVFVEDLATGKITKLTNDGNRKHINGTFDWAYEEEFSCRDGILWSPDSKQLAFWQVDATKIRDFYMINNTDSVYSKIVPVEYPTAGQTPSPVRIGIADVETQNTKWVPVPGDPQQNYIPRIEWNPQTGPGNELFIQQLNRKQNESRIFSYNSSDNSIREVFTDKDEAWIDIYTPWEDVYALDFRHKITWINGGKEFIWFSERDGWRHVYRISKDGKATLVTKGNYDVLDIRLVDEKGKYLYFLASPDNATQKYLYRCKLDGTGKLEPVTPLTLAGSHDYQLSPGGKFGYHKFESTSTKPAQEWVSIPQHKPLNPSETITASTQKSRVEFFKVKNRDGVEMDGWMIKPTNFDENKKYPVLFYVYTEPWGATVTDEYGTGNNYLFDGDLAAEGYIYISIDNRGTPAPKGRAWRKSIYRKIGLVNINDQADAAREILKWKFVDPERIAVWGWSGGGAATLNLMFQYPDIYKTGIAVAAVANQLTYDNIYQERFMGLPQENLDDFVKGSPITYAKNLKGNLLYVHGTGDDNVHYANAEMLINELVKNGKQFDLMVYPNRTHGIYEGEGTSEHLSKLYSDFLRENCPGGEK